MCRSSTAILSTMSADDHKHGILAEAQLSRDHSVGCALANAGHNCWGKWVVSSEVGTANWSRPRWSSDKFSVVASTVQ